MNVLNVVIAISIGAGLCLANPQRQGKFSSSVPATTFDHKLERLPANYQGQNIEVLYKLLSRRTASAAKGEFETTEQHKQRIKIEESVPILGSLTINDLFAFTLSRNNVDSEYNADRQELQVAIRIGIVSPRAAHVKLMRSLSVKTIYTYEGSHIGSNVYGTKLRVKNRRIDSYELAYDNPDEFVISKYQDKEHRKLGLTSDTDAIIVDVKMDTPTAIRAKGNLRALAVVEVRPPYIDKATHYEEATFDNPVSYYEPSYYLATRLIELWLYDLNSGQVYAKIKPNSLRKKSSATDMEQEQKVLVRLKDDSLVEVDEVRESGDGL